MFGATESTLDGRSHREFYKIHRELLKPNLEAATKILNESRTWFGLEEVESDHPCLVIPKFTSSTVQGPDSQTPNVSSSNEGPVGLSERSNDVQLEAPDGDETQQSQAPETDDHSMQKKKARRFLPSIKRKKSQRKTKAPLPPPLDLTSITLRAAGLEGSSELTPEMELDQ